VTGRDLQQHRAQDSLHRPVEVGAHRTHLQADVALREIAEPAIAEGIGLGAPECDLEQEVAVHVGEHLYAHDTVGGLGR